eukprot:672453-Pelagomonas_calceolata.AAC.1
MPTSAANTLQRVMLLQHDWQIEKGYIDVLSTWAAWLNNEVTVTEFDQKDCQAEKVRSQNIV